MDVGASSWLVILLALAGANLPFFNDKLFAVVALKGTDMTDKPARARKPLAVRLGEMAVLYFLVGGAAILLEGRIGGVFPQKWEFYAITACLFIVLAFPGFVARYLYKPRR
ncbi:DUF2818 family protein [Pseudoduganella namucuonensis]|uniref:DUF2818 family protein n=1 Tax=Pseudoduganella namucuonensis TaxID=1035707 RepID=A0A1I7JNM9_9BURK|nr:DUF2818 family protein [Pseudoduganella namucuonensis]SFU86759.1 Protein of unknown function [Pseudoduganella namucuonensis]